MKTKDLQERLQICQDLTSMLKYADSRISGYEYHLEKFKESLSPAQWFKTMRDIDCTERAKNRIRQRLSKVLMGIYADLTPMDEIHEECTDRVKAIEHQGYFDHPMFFETNENFKNLGL